MNKEKKNNLNKEKKNSRFFRVVLVVILALGILAVIINWAMVLKGKKRVITAEEATQGDYDCILVLGCGVRPDGTPCAMLADRMEVGVQLWQIGAADKLLLSGDHGTDIYNEVSAMKKCAYDAGVSADDIFLDHAGFSTYDSIYRAKHIFGVEKCIIVTQQYHLYRALKIADAVGIDAVGVSADLRPYADHYYNEAREFAARTKEFLKCIFMPESEYLGDPIDITGSGKVTHDEA